MHDIHIHRIHPHALSFALSHTQVSKASAACMPADKYPFSSIVRLIGSRGSRDWRVQYARDRVYMHEFYGNESMRALPPTCVAVATRQLILLLALGELLKCGPYVNVSCGCPFSQLLHLKGKTAEISLSPRLAAVIMSMYIRRVFPSIPVLIDLCV